MPETDPGPEPDTVELLVRLVPEAQPGTVEHAQLLAGAAALGITVAPVDPVGAAPELATDHVAVTSSRPPTSDLAANPHRRDHTMTTEHTASAALTASAGRPELVVVAKPDLGHGC